MRAQLEHLSREVRDPTWAAASEELLNNSYAAMPHVGGRGRTLQTYCGAEHCVTFGELSEGMSGELQSLDHIKAMMAKGYWSGGSAFGGSPSGDRNVFLIFYRRDEPTILP